MTWWAWVWVALAVERGVELVVSQRNLRWSRARGGVEWGAGHYRWMVLLHMAFLLGLAVEPRWLGAAPSPVVSAIGAVGAVGAQALRWWCITTLGPRWNTRVVIVPGLSPVVAGPYRWLRHPNYVAVVLEGVALPLLGGAYLTGVVFTVLNAWLLTVRIRVEDAALATLPSPEAA